MLGGDLALRAEPLNTLLIALILPKVCLGLHLLLAGARAAGSILLYLGPRVYLLLDVNALLVLVVCVQDLRLLLVAVVGVRGRVRILAHILVAEHGQLDGVLRALVPCGQRPLLALLRVLSIEVLLHQTSFVASRSRGVELDAVVVFYCFTFEMPSPRIALLLSMRLYHLILIGHDVISTLVQDDVAV